MNCDCVEKMDAALKLKNLRLVSRSFVMPDFELVPTMETAWIDKVLAPKGRRTKPPAVFVSHCLFYGKAVKP